MKLNSTSVNANLIRKRANTSKTVMHDNHTYDVTGAQCTGKTAAANFSNFELFHIIFRIFVLAVTCADVWGSTEQITRNVTLNS